MNGSNSTRVDILIVLSVKVWLWWWGSMGVGAVITIITLESVENRHHIVEQN